MAGITWKQIKDNSFIGLIAVSAIIPFLINMLILIPRLSNELDELAVLRFNSAAIIFQVGIILFIMLDIFKDTIKPGVHAYNRIIASTIWKECAGGKYENMFIFAFNGRNFIDMIKEHNIRIDNVYCIFPTNEVTGSYYDQDTVIADKDKEAVKLFALNSIQEGINGLEALKNDGRIKKYHYKRINSFGTHFFSILGNRKCIEGYYIKDTGRNMTVGIRSTSIQVVDKERIEELRILFNSYYAVL